MPDLRGVSYTKFEFQTAREAGKDCLFFLIDEHTVGFPVGLTEGIRPEDLEKQQDFRREIGELFHCRKANNPDDLRRLVCRSLKDLDQPSPPDIPEDHIARYTSLVNQRQYEVAFQLFQEHLNYKLDFILSRHTQHLDLLLKLFPNGEAGESLLSSPQDKAAALNALARAYKNLGYPGTAIRIYQRQLELKTTGKSRVVAHANLANALRLTGKLSYAESEALSMFEEARQLNQPTWEAYSFYWNGVLRAGRGNVDEGVKLLRRAQVIFEDIADADKEGSAAGAGRVYAHLAQIELWLDNPRGALLFAQHSQRLAQIHKQPRESIFTERLIGIANLQLNDFEGSRRSLKKAIKEAEECEYFEEKLAAVIGLAELERLEGHLQAARQRLNEDLCTKAQTGSFALLLSDFFNSLARIHRDKGRITEAVESARRAYSLARCDGPPYQYHWGLKQAEKLLLELREPLPRHSLGISPLDAEESIPANLRAEFTALFRRVTGHYRYAPTKFLKILHENWQTVRSIVTGKDIQKQPIPPQFIEIHVDHRCNLSCQYCRGELREIPAEEQFLPKKLLLDLIEDIYQLNNSAFIRFSGLIGEPLLHPEIVEVFKAVNRKVGLSWGLTTNGIRLQGRKLLNELLMAKYVHISVDAGSNETYKLLKGGNLGNNFNKVIDNIGLLAAARPSPKSSPEIIVSFLLQEQNHGELRSLAEKIRAAGADSLEIKMQHYDLRRRMPESSVQEAYDTVEELRRDFSGSRFHLVVVQSRDEALCKIKEDENRINFPRCYASMLGLSATIDPTGAVQTCCQYYLPTLGSVGTITEKRLTSIWSSRNRSKVHQSDPRDHCKNCSPSDEFVNRFVHFLEDAHKRDPSFLDWVEKETWFRDTQRGQ